MRATATIRLPEYVIARATRAGMIEHRKASQQIEYWAEIAQCGIDNPDLTFSEIKDMIAAVLREHCGDRVRVGLVDGGDRGRPDLGAGRLDLPAALLGLCAVADVPHGSPCCSGARWARVPVPSVA